MPLAGNGPKFGKYYNLRLRGIYQAAGSLHEQLKADEGDDTPQDAGLNKVADKKYHHHHHHHMVVLQWPIAGLHRFATEGECQLVGVCGLDGEDEHTQHQDISCHLQNPHLVEVE